MEINKEEIITNEIIEITEIILNILYIIINLDCEIVKNMTIGLNITKN